MSKIDKGEVPKQLNFLKGGENIEFEFRVKSFGLSTDSIQLIDFLQSDYVMKF